MDLSPTIFGELQQSRWHHFPIVLKLVVKHGNILLLEQSHQWNAST
jgi:hypothetical protein